MLIQAFIYAFPMRKFLCRYAISQHPEVEQRICEELDALGLLVSPSQPQPRQFEHADLGKLTYLSCVIKVRCFRLSCFFTRFVGGTRSCMLHTACVRRCTDADVVWPA